MAEESEEYLAEYEALLQKATQSQDRRSSFPGGADQATSVSLMSPSFNLVSQKEVSEMDSVSKQEVASDFLAALQQEEPLAGESSLVKVLARSAPQSPTHNLMDSDELDNESTVVRKPSSPPPATAAVPPSEGYPRSRFKEFTTESGFEKAWSLENADTSDTLEEELRSLKAGRGSEPAVVYGGVGITSTVVDMDIDNLAVQLEDQARVLSKVVVNQFVEVKRKLLLHETEALEAGRRHSALQLAAKQREVDSMQTEMQTMTRRMDRMKAMADRAASLVARRSQEKRDICHLASVLWRWRVFAKHQKRATKMFKASTEFYNRRVLLKKALRFWRHESTIGQRQKVQAAAQESVAQEKERLANEFAAYIQQLQDALTRAKGQLAIEAHQREAQEENMKQAFMRGVCALNIEAMALIHKDKPKTAALNLQRQSLPLQELNGPQHATGGTQTGAPDKSLAAKGPTTAAEWYLQKPQVIDNKMSTPPVERQEGEDARVEESLAVHDVDHGGAYSGDKHVRIQSAEVTRKVEEDKVHARMAPTGRVVVAEKVVRSVVRHESPKPRTPVPRPSVRASTASELRSKGPRWM